MQFVCISTYNVQLTICTLQCKIHSLKFLFHVISEIKAHIGARELMQNAIHAKDYYVEGPQISG